MAPTAAVEAARAQEMFVIGTSWPTASKVGASATKPTKGLVLYVYKAAASAARSFCSHAADRSGGFRVGLLPLQRQPWARSTRLEP